MASIITKERVSYKIWDKVNKVWRELMFKTNANSVDANDGKTLETKIGAINGVTSDINGEANDVAASIKCVNSLNSRLKGFEPVLDSTGKITGYKTSVGGADTVFPFSGLNIEKIYTNIGTIHHYQTSSSLTASASLNVPKGKYLALVAIMGVSTRHSDKVTNPFYAILSPVYSDNANLLSKGENFVIVESENDIAFSSSFGRAGFAGGYLFIGIQIIACKIK